MRFAVVGGGVAGMSAAWELANGGLDGGGAEVTLYEPGHLGGKLLTTSFLGRPVDKGPDSLITRVPDGVGLCRELGLEEELVAPAASRAVLFSGGKLRPLPEGLVLGAPARLLPLARSRILSPAGYGAGFARRRTAAIGPRRRRKCVRPPGRPPWPRGCRTPGRTAPRYYPRRYHQTTERGGHGAATARRGP